MKKIVSLLLVLCFCFGLAACGKSAKDNAPSASAPAAAPAEAPSEAPAAEAAPALAPEKTDLQQLVDELNAEEVAQRTDDDPSIGVFEVGKQENTIVYKFAMHIFQYVIMMAQGGDAENLNAYNRLLDSMPSLQVSLESALRESNPDVHVVVYLMTNEYSDEATAVIENGEITYDLVNGIGTAPVDATAVLTPEELPPEVQNQLEEFAGSLNGAA